MVEDDACTTFVELLKKLMDIVGTIEKEKQQISKKAVEEPEIKVGKLSKKDFNKLQSLGKEFKYMTVPADKLAELSETVKKMGGSFFDAHLNEDNNHVIAVPASQMDLLNMALKHVVAKEISDNADIDVKDGSGLISETDMRILNDVNKKYDIPIVSFKTEDGQYLNIVPKEFEGQYENALQEAKNLSAEIENIDVVRYDQTAPLDNLDRFAEIVSLEEAEEIATAKLDIEFIRQKNNEIAILYKSEIAEKVAEVRKKYAESLENSEEYLIDIMDNVITLDVDKLMVDSLCDDDSYFMKVPNTSGQDFIRIDRESTEFINNGKTIKTEIDIDKKYPIFDSDGSIKREISGMELAKYFNTKNIRANDKTEVFRYGVKGDEIRRIDLYCKAKNELISMKFDDAENIRIILKERGFSNGAAEKLLADINKSLTDNQKEIFNYTAIKTEIVYADVPNIGEYLAQTQLSKEVLAKADCMGELPKDTGAKCFIHDKNKHAYTVVPVAPLGQIKAMLANLGYDENAARELANKITDTYRAEDFFKTKPKEIKTSDIIKLAENNAELRNMGYYNSGGKTVVVKETDEDYHYMQIEKGTSAESVEKALREDFGIADDISIAAAIKEFQSEEIIPKDIIKDSKEAEISKITSNIIEVKCKKTGDSVTVNINGINAENLMKIGLSEKAANDIIKSFDKSFAEVGSVKQTLSGLISHAENLIKKIPAFSGKSEIGKGDER